MWLHQNSIKNPICDDEVVRQRRAEIRRLLERLRKCDTEWTACKGTSRAQGRWLMHTLCTQNCSAAFELLLVGGQIN